MAESAPAAAIAAKRQLDIRGLFMIPNTPTQFLTQLDTTRDLRELWNWATHRDVNNAEVDEKDDRSKHSAV